MAASFLATTTVYTNNVCFNKDFTQIFLKVFEFENLLEDPSQRAQEFPSQMSIEKVKNCFKNFAKHV